MTFGRWFEPERTGIMVGEEVPNVSGGRTDALRGLTSVDVAMRRREFGANLLVPDSPRRRLTRLLGPIADPMVLLLLVAAPTYLAIGETVDAVVTFIAVVPVAGVGWLLEVRAERTLDRLRELSAPRAVVIRDGVEQSVSAVEVVVDDLVRVHEGDIVPADAALVECTQIMVDESSLTGESLPVSKQVGATGDDGAVFAGTTVVSGAALVSVTAVGGSTRYGGIGTLVAATRTSPTPLQEHMGRLVRVLLVVAVGFCVMVVVVALVRGEGWGAALISGVSLAIAAVPEEFPVVYTLYLALGAWRLAQDRALVRRLPSVETLGSTTVICADKTGTLTAGRVTVAALWTPTDGIETSSAVLGPHARALLEAAVLACERDPFDPLESAIVDRASDAGIDVQSLRDGGLVHDWPFDPADKYMTHVWAASGERIVASKGSIEGIVRHCVPEPDVHRAASLANARCSEDGMRVIAVARGVGPATPVDRATDEAGLRLVGLVAFEDPIRVGVRDAVAECLAAGIRVVMITGDHPTTAHAVAEGLGLPHQHVDGDLVVTGDMLDAANDGELTELVDRANVFARIRPEQKHQLVRLLRDRDAVVAMTGDGINDAPALREADIGVAMGERGTAAAREAASLVLLDDNFATIVGAVRDGRRIVDNLVRAFAYVIAFHPPLLVAALVVPLLDRPLLLLPVHLVVLELVLHPIVALAFQADPPDVDTMRRPPRSLGDALSWRRLVWPLVLGTVLAVVVVAVHLVALRSWPEEQARALAFSSLLAAQPLLLLSVRSPGRPFWSSRQRWTPTLWAILVALVVAVPVVVYVGPLASVLHLSPFPFAWWLLVGAIAIGTAWSEPWKRIGAPDRPE